jgi:hypothetical protein
MSLINHQGFGVQIGKIEIKFSRTICRIERRTHRTRGNTEKCGRHLWSVLQDDCHAIATADAHRAERPRHSFHVPDQPKIIERVTPRREDGG